MKKQNGDSLKAFLIEIGVYAVLVVGYLLLVTWLLTRPIKTLYDYSKLYYAGAALLLIVAQGVMLESLTTLLVHLLGPKPKAKKK
jgi:hypothetical protein